MGFLVFIEGVDGAGKTTLVDHLALALPHLGLSFQVVREPGGTEFGEHFREALKSPKIKMSPFAQLLGLFAAREQLYDEVVENAIASDLVISDRSWWSSAYQMAQGVSWETVRWLVNRRAALEPDLVILLDLPVSKIKRRNEERRGDRFDDNTAFLELVRDQYLFLAQERQKLRKALVVLDADANSLRVASQAYEAIAQLVSP